MHWLAEQGLAAKRVFLIVISLLIFMVVELVKRVLNDKEDKRMINKLNTIDVLNVSLKVTSDISSNIAGGALLTNAFYEMLLRDTG